MVVNTNPGFLNISFSASNLLLKRVQTCYHRPSACFINLNISLHHFVDIGSHVHAQAAGACLKILFSLRTISNTFESTYTFSTKGKGDLFSSILFSLA